MSTYRYVDGPFEGKTVNIGWPPMTKEREARFQASGGNLRWLSERLEYPNGKDDWESARRIMSWTHWLDGESVLSISREPLSEIEIDEEAKLSATYGMAIIENSMRPMGRVTAQH